MSKKFETSLGKSCIVSCLLFYGRLDRMGKSFGIALILACLPVQMMMVCEPASAQTASNRKAQADRHLNQASQLYGIKEYREAFAAWEQALQIYREINDRDGERSSLFYLGRAYDKPGEYQKAINFFQQSLAISKQIGNRFQEKVSLTFLGSAYNSLGQYQKAIDFYQQFLALVKQNGDRNRATAHVS